ncbi:MAG: Ferredoxin-dependent glutamate synthase, partial [uncultured Solirubrobacteraceae bacterium]
ADPARCALGGGGGARRPRRRGGARPAPAPPRDPAQLPRRRARALPPRGARPRAAPVRRGLEQRGAPVLPRPAPLGVRVVQGAAEHLRLRDGRRDGRRRRPHRAQAGRVPAARAGARPARRSPGVPLRAREGPGRRAPPPARVPPALGGEHLRDELRLPVAPGGGGAQPRRGAGAVPAEHGGGRAGARAPPRRRARLPDRDGLLRLPRGGRGVQPRAPAPAPGRGPGPRAGDQALPGRQAGARRDAARGEGHAGDRGDPRGPPGRGLRLAAAAHRVRRRGRPRRVRRAPRRGDGAARRHQGGGGRPGLLARPRRPHGRDGRRPGLRHDRRRRGRHGRRPAGLRRPRRAAVQDRLLAGLRRLRRGGARRRRGLRRRGPPGLPGRGAVRLRAGLRHGERRAGGDAGHRLHPGPEVPPGDLPHGRGHAVQVAHARPGSGPQARARGELRARAARRGARALPRARRAASRARGSRPGGDRLGALPVGGAARGVRLRAGVADPRRRHPGGDRGPRRDRAGAQGAGSGGRARARRRVGGGPGAHDGAARRLGVGLRGGGRL